MPAEQGGRRNLLPVLVLNLQVQHRPPPEWAALLLLLAGTAAAWVLLQELGWAARVAGC